MNERNFWVGWGNYIIFKKLHFKLWVSLILRSIQKKFIFNWEKPGLRQKHPRDDANKIKDQFPQHSRRKSRGHISSCSTGIGGFYLINSHPWYDLKNADPAALFQKPALASPTLFSAVSIFFSNGAQRLDFLPFSWYTSVSFLHQLPWCEKKRCGVSVSQIIGNEKCKQKDGMEIK